MNRAARTIVSVAFAVAAVAGVRSSAHAGDDLLQRMIALNPGVQSFEAQIHADVHMTSFPYISPTLDGTYYHKSPNMDKVVFTSGLPGVAKQFSKMYPRIDGPATWNALYVVKQTDDGKTTTFTLTPRKHGRIDHIDVGVDDASATIQSMHWAYNDGSGYVDMQQQYAKVDGNTVVVKQTGHVEQSMYKADISATLDNYTFNPALPDQFFNQSP